MPKLSLFLWVVGSFVLGGCATVNRNAGTPSAEVSRDWSIAQKTNTAEGYDAFLAAHPEADPEVTERAIVEKRKILLKAEWKAVAGSARLGDYLDTLKSSCATAGKSPRSAHFEAVQTSLYQITQILKNKYYRPRDAAALFVEAELQSLSQARYESSAPGVPTGCHYFAINDSKPRRQRSGITQLKGFAYHLQEANILAVTAPNFHQSPGNQRSVDLSFVKNGAFRYEGKAYLLDGAVFFNGKLYRPR